MKQLDSFFRSMLNCPLPRVSGILLVGLLLFASCGGDDSSDESYAAVESDSFTFDEAAAANNAVRVMANGAWQVYWEPASAAVTVNPSSGSGNGTFQVLDMPKGTSVKIGVRTASGKTSGKTITVTRAAAPAEVTLSVAPADLSFNPAGTNRITVTSNASWSASCPNSALVFSPASGTGDGTITVTDAPEGVRCTLTVTAGEGAGTKTQSVEILHTPYRFPELASNWVQPSKTAAIVSGDYAFYTHWSKTVKTARTVRNYSYCYDTRRHNPIWVAYPLADCYGEGGYGRTNPDPWAPDPRLDASYQSKIYKSDGATGTDPYQYWSNNTIRTTLGLSGSWTKGHLCMSSERGGKDSEINRQTFYPTNIAPQPNAAASTFGTVWGCIESVISGSNNVKNDITADDGSTNRNRVADTLFVVAGCYYEHDNWKDFDSSDYSQPTPDPNQKQCIMPTHQWKMMLRTKAGNTKKRIADCTADELQAVAFWIETFIDSDLVNAETGAGTKAQLRAIAVPVSFIEEKMGMTFFPGVPDAVKSRTPVPEEWGF